MIKVIIVCCLFLTNVSWAQYSPKAQEIPDTNKAEVGIQAVARVLKAAGYFYGEENPINNPTNLPKPTFKQITIASNVVKFIKDEYKWVSQTSDKDLKKYFDFYTKKQKEQEESRLREIEREKKVQIAWLMDHGFPLPQNEAQLAFAYRQGKRQVSLFYENQICMDKIDQMGRQTAIANAYTQLQYARFDARHALEIRAWQWGFGFYNSSLYARNSGTYIIP